MARTAVTPVAVAANAGTDVKSATVSVALDPTNGHSIATNGRTGRYLIHVKNTAAGAKNITVLAGDNPPAWMAGVGNLVVAVALTSGEQMIVVEAARFAQSDGAIHVDVEAATTGTIAVYQVPVL
jgi:hypothetical protein